MTERETYAVKRSIAIKQYRFLIKMEKLACARRLYNLAAKYRIERLQLKAAWNL